MAIIQNERTGEINGVPGRFHNVVTWAGNGSAKAPNEIANQKWTSAARMVSSKDWGPGRVIRAKIRFDDNCKNGKKSFSITGEITRPGARDWDAGGCIHEEIARYFPELAPLIKWHLMDEKGPLHYVANTMHHASDRDCWGKRKGEASRFDHVVRFGGVPISHPVKQSFWAWMQETDPADLQVIDISESKPDSSGKPFIYRGFTFGGYPDATAWHKAPFKTERAAFEFLEAWQAGGVQFDRIATEWSEGKPRDLEAARNAAVWPDAPDALLTGPEDQLRAALEARRPALVAEFRAAMDACGFISEGGAA